MVLRPEEEEKSVDFLNFSNRENCTYKWQRARNVVGALEVRSEPELKPEEHMEKRYYDGRENMFMEAIEQWEKEQLKKEFVTAVNSLPVATCCCGFVTDAETTKKELINMLNEGWAKRVNKKLSEKGFKIDTFLWNWPNASGKAETNIILIRFFITSSYTLMQAATSSSSSLRQIGSPYQSNTP